MFNQWQRMGNVSQRLPIRAAIADSPTNVVDYLLIESSGISEPQQVAEAFTMDFYDMLEEEEVCYSLSVGAIH